MSKTSKPTFKGYTQQDWEEVSDNPELTPADFQKARPGAETFPELAARRRGRPKADAPKVAVKLRIAPDVLAAYQAGGPGWQTRMNEALRKGLPGPLRSSDKSPRVTSASRNRSIPAKAPSGSRSSPRSKTRG